MHLLAVNIDDFLIPYGSYNALIMHLLAVNIDDFLIPNGRYNALIMHLLTVNIVNFLIHYGRYNALIMYLLTVNIDDFLIPYGRYNALIMHLLVVNIDDFLIPYGRTFKLLYFNGSVDCLLVKFKTEFSINNYMTVIQLDHVDAQNSEMPRTVRTRSRLQEHCRKSYIWVLSKGTDLP